MTKDIGEDEARSSRLSGSVKGMELNLMETALLKDLLTETERQ